MLELDLQLQRGAFRLEIACRLTESTHGLFGPSGAGKTTILHALAGLTRPQAGRMVLDGEVLFDHARRIHVPPHRRGIGVVFQDNRLFPHHTVRENLRYGQRAGRRRLDGVSMEAVVDVLELGPLLARAPNSLSGGERRRVALGRSLLASPRLLLLDEPLAGLDHGRKEQILPFLRRVQAELHVPMLLVSHDLGDILHLTDSMLVVDRGRLVAAGTPTQLVQQPDALALMHGAGLLNVLRLQVAEHKAEPGTTVLASQPGASETEFSPRRRFVLRGPHLPAAPVGCPVDAILRPEDIILALGPLEHVSVQNQLRGRVRHLVLHAERALCVVDAGPILLVDVTRQAVADLRLAPGRPIWCLFKAHAIQCVAMASAGASVGASAVGELLAPPISASAASRGAESSCSPPGAMGMHETTVHRNPS